MCRCWSWWRSQRKSTTMSTPRLTNSLKLTVGPPFLGYPYFDLGGTFFGRNESSFIAFASLAIFTEITRHDIVVYFLTLIHMNCCPELPLRGPLILPIHVVTVIWLLTQMNTFIMVRFFILFFSCLLVVGCFFFFTKPLNCFRPDWRCDWEEGNGGWGGGEEIREDNDKKTKT